MQIREQAILITVYSDAAKAEIGGSTLAWFRDEVFAVAAACEHILFKSAILADLRKLPTIKVEFDYRLMASKHVPIEFVRGTKAKETELGRKIVLLPCVSGKPWIQKEAR